VSLEFRDVSKSYGAVVALKRASLSIEKGEIRGLLGGNGSGKSTLAKISGGLVKLGNGDIIYKGKSIKFHSPKQAKQNGVVITSQELSLFTNLTVEENLTICDIPKNIGIFSNIGKIREKAVEVLKQMNLDQHIGEKVDGLPPNIQYMIEFAKAILQNPQILIVDEITSALYREDVIIIDRMLKQLKDDGKIVIFISHRMNELYSICDSVTVMRNGETLGTYRMQEKSEIELLSLMTGRDIAHRHRVEAQSEDELAKEGYFIIANDIKIASYSTSIRLAIHPGEVIGIAGLQGHGQSELVKGLFGLVGPIALVKNGQTINISNPKQAVKEGFAFISGDREKDGVFNERNIYENISPVVELVKHKILANPKQIVDSFGIKHDNIKQPILSLSGGNQQKVVVGRWLANDLNLILADDPTKGIDVQARTELHTMFCKMAEKGCPVVMVSSDDDELVNLTAMSSNSRVIVMYEGQIVRSLRGEEITIENIAAASMPDKRAVLI
jgi:ABC-type sugar transport system ATPase subunit